MLKLDFTIITSKEREKFITELLQDKTIKYTQKEIETMANKEVIDIPEEEMEIYEEPEERIYEEQQELYNGPGF